MKMSWKKMEGLWLAMMVFFPTALPAAEIQVKTASVPLPADLSAKIKGILSTNAYQVNEGGKALYTFWLVSELPVKAKPESPGKSLDQLAPATFLGVATISAGRRDYRDDELPARTYTLRFALQPQDGNHLGTSEFLYFAVLVPAAHDSAPEAITDYKTLVKVSSKETSTDHPLVLSLRPVATAEKVGQLSDPVADHTALRLEIPAREKKGSVLFDLVVKGVAKK